MKKYNYCTWFFYLLACVIATSVLSAVPVSSASAAKDGSPAGAVSPLPLSNHVFIVVEENHSYSEVIGNPAMPYLNALANQYGLATRYYADTHPSIGNYFMLTAGEIITNDDSFCGLVNHDNVVRQLLISGRTWKAYAESLPKRGYTGCDQYPYAKRHNPLSYFSDVVNSSQKQNLVPFTQFATDLAHKQLPNFSFIVPNLLNDAHDGSLSQADRWLKKNIAPLLSNSVFKTDGILIIVFDESAMSDTNHGGGHVACVVIGPKVKRRYKSHVTYQLENALKTLMLPLEMDGYPGKANAAAPMSDFF